MPTKARQTFSSPRGEPNTTTHDTCSTCRFARSDCNEVQGTVIICHRFPPAVVVIDGKPTNMRTAMRPDEWCGEHRGRIV